MDKTGTIWFDGYCNLCSWSVRFIKRNDRKGRFAFRPLQEKPAEKHIPDRDRMDISSGTVILDLNGRIFTRSAAALRILVRLRFPWPLSAIFFIVPRFLRDPVYNWIARNRKKWFGERSTCYLA